MTAPLTPEPDVETWADAIRESMSSDDRQSRFTYDEGLRALNLMTDHIDALTARIRALEVESDTGYHHAAAEEWARKEIQAELVTAQARIRALETVTDVCRPPGKATHGTPVTFYQHPVFRTCCSDCGADITPEAL